MVTRGRQVTMSATTRKTAPSVSAGFHRTMHAAQAGRRRSPGEGQGTGGDHEAPRREADGGGAELGRGEPRGVDEVSSPGARWVDSICRLVQQEQAPQNAGDLRGRADGGTRTGVACPAPDDDPAAGRWSQPVRGGQGTEVPFRRRALPAAPYTGRAGRSVVTVGDNTVSAERISPGPPCVTVVSHTPRPARRGERRAPAGTALLA